MSFWKRWFGGETPEQRVARARDSVADGELEHAIRTLTNVSGPEADAIRAEARQRIADRDAASPLPEARVVERDPAEDAAEPRAGRRRDAAPAGNRIDPPPTPASIRVQLTSGQLGGMLATSVARQPLGDATMMIVADLEGMAEVTMSWDDLAAIGVGRDEAFALGRRNALAQVVDGIVTQSIALPGATCDVAICNGFYLGGAMLEMREHLPAGAPQIVCPLSWHHWFVFELQPDATHETLAAMRQLVDQIAGSITTIGNVSAWVTRSLWWWPIGAAAPVVIDPAALPADLAARLPA